MGATKVVIFNMALRRILHKARVEGEFDKSFEAQQCRDVYERSVRDALAAFDWNFARMYRTGSALDIAAPHNFQFAYNYPSDCVKMRGIDKDHPQEPLPRFEVARKLDGTGQMILCNKSPAMLIFTSYVDNPVVFDDPFVSVLGWRMASEIAGPITKDLKRAKECREQFQLEASAGGAANSNEGTKFYTDQEPDWIAARS